MTWRPKVVPVVDEEVVRVYLLDRAGLEANAFGTKLDGREGIDLVGGADDLDDALEEIREASADLILVATDFGGAGCVSAVESLLSVHPEATVVMLTTAADKALVSAAIRAGAVGSLDRGASPGESVTALHLHSRRGRGEDVDLALAEPPAENRGLRVSGALPVFPGGAGGAVEPGVEATAITGSGAEDPAGGDEAGAATDGDQMAGLRARLEGEDAPKKRRLRLFGRGRHKTDKAKDWGPSAAKAPKGTKAPKAGRRGKAAGSSREAAEAMLRRDAELQRAKRKEREESR